jgi:hypothetical protein
MTTTGKNRIMIFGPKTDGTYVVEFRTAEGESLAISIPRTETAVQERMPYGAGILKPCNSPLLSSVQTGGDLFLGVGDGCDQRICCSQFHTG